MDDAGSVLTPRWQRRLAQRAGAVYGDLDPEYARFLYAEYGPDREYAEEEHAELFDG